MSRLPPLKRETLSPAQAEVFNQIAAGARGGVRGPFTALLHSPELARRVEQLGVYVRFQCAVPVRQRELAICIVGAHWRAAYEWHVHAAIALKQGLTPKVLDAIAARETPVFDEPLDKAVYDYAVEILRTGRAGDAAYNEAKAALGEAGLVDLTGLLGYYSLLAMVLNGFEVAVPDDAVIPWARTEGAAG